MSDWKVFADKIEIFPHPSADKMELGKVGSFQVVVGKSLYQTGDQVVFAPKRSVLPPSLRPYFCNDETGHSYLKGVNEDRVSSIRLRGEESEGVILPAEWWSKYLAEPLFDHYAPGEDLSEVLDIKEYIPELHSPGRVRHNQDGDIVQPVHEAVEMDRFVRHDVEQFRIFQNQFIPGEQVLVTEKIHGSQISIMKDKLGRISVTSKGRAEKNLVLREFPKCKLWKGRTFWQKIKNLWTWWWKGEDTPQNEYWRYAHDSGIIKFLRRDELQGHEIQIIGEVVPLQSGFHYGHTVQTIYVFRCLLDTLELPYGHYSESLTWVPVLYTGPYDLAKILPLSKGMETVSGNSMHIKEGVVLSTIPLRKVNHTPLMVKLVNPKYKGEDDEVR